MKRAFLISLLCTVLAACGFTPVYYGGGAAKTAQTQLAAIQIGNIPDASGQALRNFLIDRLHPHGATASAENAAYTLDVAPISEETVGIGIAKDASITRAQLRLRTHFELKDQNGTSILARDVMAVSSYGTLGSQYKNTILVTDLRDQAVRDLGEQIVSHLEQTLGN